MYDFVSKYTANKHTDTDTNVQRYPDKKGDTQCNFIPFVNPSRKPETYKR